MFGYVNSNVSEKNKPNLETESKIFDPPQNKDLHIYVLVLKFMEQKLEGNILQQRSFSVT